MAAVARGPIECMILGLGSESHEGQRCGLMGYIRSPAGGWLLYQKFKYRTGTPEIGAESRAAPEKPAPSEKCPLDAHPELWMRRSIQSATS